MRRLLMLGCLLLAGCSSVRGPFEPRPPVRVDDPGVPIGEQQRRGREHLSLPEESRHIAPPSGAARPGQSAFDR